MITEADHAHWTPEDLRPYIDHVVDCFGWDRVIYGSDWPVCTLAGNYDQVINGLTKSLRSRMDAAAEKKLFGMKRRFASISWIDANDNEGWNSFCRRWNRRRDAWARCHGERECRVDRGI